MKRRIICTLLIAVTLFASVLTGCGKRGSTDAVFSSENYIFTEDMVRYMLSYTAATLEDEIRAEGGDFSVPLTEQYREDGESFAHYIAAKTAENITQMLTYSEAALKSDFAVSEGMLYRANETLSYLSTLAEQYGMTDDEYVEYAFGEGVTLKAYRTCIEMMTLCEGYDLYLFNSVEVTDEDAAAYADENADRFLEYDCLRYTVKDKAAAESLAAAADKDEFVTALKRISGMNITDSNKNGIPDVAEVSGVNVESDISGEFAAAAGREVFDTETVENGGSYTVTMLLSLPARNRTELWDFRAVFLSEETAEGSLEDCTSLIEQIREKGTGEEGFTNIAYRYSENAYAYYGGLYSGISRSEMPAASVKEWICDPARREGDMTAVADGEVGSYMLYFLHGPEESWLYSAKAAIRSEEAKEIIEGAEEDGTVGEIVSDTEWLIRIADDFLAQ